MYKRDSKQERSALIADLRTAVVNFNGPIEDAPEYKQLARLLVSECVMNTLEFK